MDRRSFLKGALLAVGMAGINLGMLTREEPEEPIDRDFNFVYQRIYASDIGHYIASSVSSFPAAPLDPQPGGIYGSGLVR